MKEPNKTQILGNHLWGTCENRDVAMTRLGIEEDEIDFYELDEITLNCDVCGWWCEPCEVKTYDGNNCCDACAEENGYGEDE